MHELLFSRRCFRNGLAKVFLQIFQHSFPGKACGHYRTCFIGHTRIYFIDDFIVNWGKCGPWRAICFREELVMTELSDHVNVINVFYDVSSNLYTVSSIHYMTGFLLKVDNVFNIAKLTLFMVNSICSIWKRATTSQKLSSKMTEDSSVKRSLFQISYTMFSTFHTKSICIKN